MKSKLYECIKIFSQWQLRTQNAAIQYKRVVCVGLDTISAPSLPKPYSPCVSVRAI